MKIHSRGKGKYKDIIDPNHPYADSRGRVALHRYIAEQKLGRYLLPKETVHHKDEIKGNNNPENLEVYPSIGEHTRIHSSTGRTYINLKCTFCGKIFKREKRKIAKGKQFCTRAHAAAFYVPKRPSPEIKHGKESGYRRGCRCDACLKGHSLKKEIDADRIRNKRERISTNGTSPNLV